MATITAVGTARPIAHGHAMTSTATAAANARTAAVGPAVAWASSTTNHTTNVAIAIWITTGTKMALTRSASA